MITEEIESIIRRNWLKAAQELNFEIITPYTISIDGNDRKVFAFLPDYGSKQGAIVCLSAQPNCDWHIKSSDHDEIWSWGLANKRFCSIIYITNDNLVYDKEYFIDILEDWKIS